MARGHASMNWFATYGWALLLILIAVGALIHFGVFDVRGLSSHCRFDAAFYCRDYVLTGSSLSFLLSNALTDDLAEVTITVTTADGSCNQTIPVGKVPRNAMVGPYVFCAGTQFPETAQGILLVTYRVEDQTLVHRARGEFVLHRKG
jgi:hypothetical protein